MAAMLITGFGDQRHPPHRRTFGLMPVSGQALVKLRGRCKYLRGGCEIDMRRVGRLAAAMSMLSVPLLAQTAEPPPVVAVADSFVLPALTPVEIEIAATVNSQANKIGEHFPIRLARPLALADGHAIPAGTTGSGDVVHAAKSRFGGKPGELILAVRYLDYGGIHIPLRSLVFLDRPRALDNQATAFAVGIAVSGVLAMFITGGEVNVPAGTIAFAKTAAPVTVPLAPPPAIIPPAIIPPASPGELKP